MSVLHHPAPFLLATLAVLVVPGPSVAYVVARSAEYGRAAGLYSVLGLEAGLLLHVVAATAGLSVLIGSSPLALTILEVAGVIFFLILGMTQFRHHGTETLVPTATEPAVGPSARRLVRDGLLVDLLNPKTALFFVAFLPQFLVPAADAAWIQSLVLGLCVVGMAFLCDGTYAVLAGGFTRRLRASDAASVWLARVTGSVYFTLAGLVVVG